MEGQDGEVSLPRVQISPCPSVLPWGCLPVSSLGQDRVALACAGREPGRGLRQSQAVGSPRWGVRQTKLLVLRVSVPPSEVETTPL